MIVWYGIPTRVSCHGGGNIEDHDCMFRLEWLAFRSEVMKSFLGVAVAEAGIWKQLGHCFFLSVI